MAASPASPAMAVTAPTIRSPEPPRTVRLAAMSIDRQFAPQPAWMAVTDGSGAPAAADRPPSTRRLVVSSALVLLVVLGAVGVGGIFAAQRIAERESVNDALTSTDLLARSVVQPLLNDGLLLDGAPGALVRQRLDDQVRDRILAAGVGIVRVKLWTPEGRIVYSDERRLVGQTYRLDEEELAVFDKPRTVGEISNLDRPENAYERGQGRLLEVYRPVSTLQGKPLLFETYFSYAEVTRRSSAIWRAFAGITVSSLLALMFLQLAVFWPLVRRTRRLQRHREELLLQAVRASQEERRRIAAHVHDGPVQQLVAASYVLVAVGDAARKRGEPDLGAKADEGAGAVRAAIGGLRSLLVDIYPPSLRAAGLASAIEDLASTMRMRGVEVTVEVGDGLDLAPQREEALFGMAQELMRNAATHAGASRVDIELRRTDDRVCLEVRDDGRGFDAARVLAEGPRDHFGLRLVRDLATRAGFAVDVASAAGHGTQWRARGRA